MNLFDSRLAVTRKKLLVLLLVAISSVYAHAQEKPIVFSGRNISIEKALGEIEAQTKYLVSINHTDFDISRKVRLSSETLPLKSALEQILYKTDRTYVLSNNYILIVPERRKPRARPAPQTVIAADTVSESWKNTVAELEVLRDYPELGLISDSYPKISFDTHRVLAKSAVARTNYQRRPARWALKTNLLYGLGTLTPNFGLEIGLGNKSTLDITGGYNPWKLEGTESKNKKLAHWQVKAEYRYWLCERFNGHFFGFHAFTGRYNISEHKIPLFLEKDAKDYRYKGGIVGGGVSYGYQWMLGKHWSLEGNIGLGYGYMKYDKYACAKCSDKLKTDVTRHYFGPTRIGISLVYVIK